MLPIPPLDGGRVAVGILPRPLAAALARIEPVGIFIVLGLFVVLPMLGAGIDPVRWLVMEPSRALIDAIAIVTGHS
jgi:Zn-dependent protease